MGLLILFDRLARMPIGEACDWTRAEARRLVGSMESVEAARLTALAGTGRDHGSHDWMLELMIPDNVGIDDVIQEPALRDFLGDLRLLGARPTVLIASDPLTLRPQR